MLSISIDPKYDFSAVDYSTNQRDTYLEGTFTGGVGPYSFTYQHFYIDRFGIERLLASGNIPTVDLVAETWLLPNLLLNPGANVVKVKITDTSDSSIAQAIVTVSYITQTQLGIRVDPPTGIKPAQYTDKVILEWLGNSTITYTEKQLTFSGELELTLVEKGAVNLDSLTVSSTEVNPLDRSVYTRDEDYIVVNSENINLPTKIYRTAESSIPDGVMVFASFQVEQALETVKGYNVYASAEAAGGSLGYSKLNSRLLTTPTALRQVVTSSTTSQTLVGGVRTTTLTERVISLNEYQFEASKVTLADFTARSTTDLTTYFVITAVATDSISRSEIESVHSLEVVAKPIEISSQIQEFSPRTFDEIVADYVSTALVSQPLLDVKPTSVTRDIHIDPVANELEKAYVMLDFVNKSQSFLTLLAIDDPDSTGTSQSGTEYKATLQLVFGLDTQEQTQALIDSQFDKLASNVNVTRKGAEYARGTATLYSLSAPASTLSITPNTVFIAPLSSGTLKFKSLVNMSIEPEEYFAYYNPSTLRYEIDVPVIAVDSGAVGNIDAGALTQTTLSNFFVSNETPFLYGSDEESNRSLAERSLVALMGVDFGTIGGYIKEVTASPGVLKVTSQAAGDPFMFRDFDPIRKVHLGGKVDLYVQGTRPLVYQDEFGLEFKRVDQEAASVNAPGSFVLVLNRIPNTLISVHKQNPLGPLQPYDIEGAILNGRTIQLNPNSEINKTLGMELTDTVLVSYYYSGDLSHRFNHLPVTSVVSVVGGSTGSIGTGNYILSTPDDVFLLGNSTQAQSKISLVESSTVSFGAESFTGTFVMSGTVPITLSQYGVDSSSIILSNGLTTYTRDVDYQIVTTGSSVVKAQLARKVGGSIPDGGSVTATFTASETILVQYQVENLVESIQASLEAKEYATADVIVKQANQVPLDISAEIILQKGVSQSEVDLRVRTELGRYFGNLRLGDAVYQSDVIRVIDGVSGVYAVQLPLLKLARASNSYVLGDPLRISSIATVSEDGYKAYRLVADLGFNTNAGGGIANGNQERSVGVFIGSRYFKGVSSQGVVQNTEDSCYISNGSLVVSNLSQEDRAKILSGEHQVISNYFTFDESGNKDAVLNVFEYAVLANLLFSYRSR